MSDNLFSNFVLIFRGEVVEPPECLPCVLRWIRNILYYYCCTINLFIFTTFYFTEFCPSNNFVITESSANRLLKTVIVSKNILPRENINFNNIKK